MSLAQKHDPACKILVENTQHIAHKRATGTAEQESEWQGLTYPKLVECSGIILSTCITYQLASTELNIPMHTISLGIALPDKIPKFQGRGFELQDRHLSHSRTLQSTWNKLWLHRFAAGNLAEIRYRVEIIIFFTTPSFSAGLGYTPCTLPLMATIRGFLWKTMCCIWKINHGKITSRKKVLRYHYKCWPGMQLRRRCNHICGWTLYP